MWILFTLVLLRSFFIQSLDVSNKNEDKDTVKDLRIEKVASQISETISQSDNQGKTFASLQCRSVRIGSYKSMPKEKAFVTEDAFQIRVPAIGNRKYMFGTNIYIEQFSNKIQT